MKDEKPRVGILIPEFPGQTHIFFWREIEALRAMGIEPELASTRLPPRGIMSHSWSTEAMEKTEYLSPPHLADLAAIGRELAHSITGGFARVAASMIRARGLPLRGRLRLIGLAAMGARLARHARERGWRHVHVHSCADAAHVAMFAHLLSGLSYSVALHSPLRDYGPNRTFGCELLPTRYDLVAAALGGHGELVQSAGEMVGAIERSLASGKPACINVMVESIPAPTLRRPPHST